MTDKENEKSSEENGISKKEGELTDKPSDLEVENFIECLDSQDVPKPVKSMMMRVMRSSGPSIDPVLEKITSEHISTILKFTRDDEIDNHKLRSTNRWFYLGAAFLAMIFFIVLLVMLLPANKDLLNELIKILVVFVGGFGSGYGIKASREKKSGD